MTTSSPSSTPSQRFAGPAIVASGAVLFAAKAVVVKCAYPLGVDALTLLTLRMVFSLPVFLVLAWRSQRRAGETMPRTLLLRCCGLGMLGYYLSSLLDFEGLVYIGVGLERMVLCLYPVLVVLGGALLLGQRLSWLVVCSLVVGLGGVGLTYAGAPMPSQHGSWGTLLVAGSATLYALFVLGSGQQLRSLGAQRFMSIAMSAACVAVIAHFLVVRSYQHGPSGAEAILHLPPAVYGYAIVLALACTVAPSLLVAEGLKRVGSQRFVIIGAIGPVATVALGWLILDEQVGLLNACGMALTVAASVATGLGKPASAPPTATPELSTLPGQKVQNVQKV